MTFVFPNIGLAETETERESSSTVFREVGVDDRLKACVVNLTVSSVPPHFPLCCWALRQGLSDIDKDHFR